MANKHRGIVEIELDKPRNLRYTLNALAEIEDKLGVNVGEMDGANLGIKAIRVILWAGLIHEDTELTETQVGEMVDFENFAQVQEKIAAAFEVATRKNV
ncbi:hypothetical protein [Heliophilum fasciatum]|uniref:Tail assembly chaperone E/41/14-like protein n=1 Tax=Heliophilum fasciatum TaxID=35700 RepID=A0A4R2RFV4_9FIRM|nr:hypothetical protein [Heliophilum fasciatum]MCW2278739.1 hypothetical protein [Heliophilum fasciatum]TCP62522.1 hypothetical protein EDD73_12120 [Heliophilum fasciatum]